MLVVFEVHLVPGADPQSLFTAEMARETQAQIMTAEEAQAVGFGGAVTPQPGFELRLIAVAKRDEGWVHRTLETSDLVAAFKMHEIG